MYIRSNSIKKSQQSILNQGQGRRLGDSLAATMASYKVVGLLSVLALVGCVPVGIKAHDPPSLLIDNLRNKKINFEQKVKMLREFEDQEAIVSDSVPLSVPVTVKQLVNHCRDSLDQCIPSRFDGRRDIPMIGAYPELDEIAEHCTSLLKKICRGNIDQLGRDIVNRMGEEAAQLMVSIMNSYKKLEGWRRDSEARRQINVLKAIDEARSGAEDVELASFAQNLFKALGGATRMHTLFTLIAKNKRNPPKAKGRFFVSNYQKAAEIAREVVSLLDGVSSDDFSLKLDKENLGPVYARSKEIREALLKV